MINVCERGLPTDIGPDGKACLKVPAGISASIIDICTPPLPIRVGPDGKPCWEGFFKPGIAGSTVEACGLGVGGIATSTDQPPSVTEPTDQLPYDLYLFGRGRNSPDGPGVNPPRNKADFDVPDEDPILTSGRVKCHGRKAVSVP